MALACALSTEPGSSATGLASIVQPPHVFVFRKAFDVRDWCKRNLSSTLSLATSSASAHHPSAMLRFSTPFAAAFIPLVPLASFGGKGLLSQTSTPSTR